VAGAHCSAFFLFSPFLPIPSPYNSPALRHSYLIQDSIVYLTIADKSYPRKLAFSYLSELSTEFNRSYPPEQALKPGLRPYAFVKFDTFIQRTKRLYLDPRGAEASGKGGQSQVGNGLDQLNEDLRDVTQIMTKNMEDLLWRGDSLDRMSTMSSSLRDESLPSSVLPPLTLSSADTAKRRRRLTRPSPSRLFFCSRHSDLFLSRNSDALIRKWAPVGAAGLFFFVFL
jgi:vesicle transport protein SEC22